LSLPNRSNTVVDYDVLVVGAGLAGLTAAAGLARCGHSVMLVDARTRLDRGVRTTGIFVRRTFEDFALPEDCLGPPVRRVVLHSPGGRTLALESDVDEFRVGHMGALYGRLLAECESAGVEWRPGTRFRCAAAIEGGSAVWLESRGRKWRTRVRFIVGADGAVSRVGAVLRLDRNDEWIVGVEDVHAGTGQEEPAFHCFIDPRIAPGYLGWLIDDGESVHIGVGGYADRFEPARAQGAQRARLHAAGRRFGERVERRGGRIPVNGVLRRIACPRGLLVGDAAGAVSPLTAGGLDPCLRLTALAVRVTSDYLSTGAAGALAPYDGGRFRARFGWRLLMRRMMSGVRHAAVAEAGCALLRAWPFSIVAPRVFFGRGSFPDVEPRPAARAPVSLAEQRVQQIREDQRDDGGAHPADQHRPGASERELAVVGAHLVAGCARAPDPRREDADQQGADDERVLTEQREKEAEEVGADAGQRRQPAHRAVRERARDADDERDDAQGGRRLLA
jgi:flavin-dependent dehydrogenase